MYVRHPAHPWISPDLVKKSNLIGQLHGYLLLKSNTLYLYTCGVLYELSCASLDQSLKIFRIVKVLLVLIENVII